MIKRFNEEPTNASRALQIYLILIGCATRHETITYRQLGEKLGYASPNRGAGALGDRLAPLMFWCEQESLPALTSLVVDATTGIPGEGIRFDVRDIPAKQQQEKSYGWFALMPPTIEDLKAAVEHGHR
jgi:hypothetical protein